MGDLPCLSQQDIEDMDKFIHGTVLKDYPDIGKTTEECAGTQNEEENPSILRAEVIRKRPLPQKQSNQVC